MFNLTYFTINPHTEITDTVKDFKNYKINNPSFISFKHIDYDFDMDWNKNIHTLSIIGVINFSLNCSDAFTGKHFEYSDSIDWNDEYTFDKENNDQINLINSDEFDILNYVVEQINVNLPYNLEHNSDIIKKSYLNGTFMTQDEYENELQNKEDPRWENLDKLKEKE